MFFAPFIFSFFFLTSIFFFLTTIFKSLWFVPQVLKQVVNLSCSFLLPLISSVIFVLVAGHYQKSKCKIHSSHIHNHIVWRIKFGILVNKGRILMSPVSPVLHTVVTVSIVLKNDNLPMNLHASNTVLCVAVLQIRHIS